MQRVKERFPEVFELARKANEGLEGGHDIWHALRVAHWAQYIAIEEWCDLRTAELAGLAGLCHNADRILQKNFGKENITEEKVVKMIKPWIAKSDTTPKEEEEVILAILCHSQKNDHSHSKVAIALMDADRVVNLELDLIIRSGQHYHDLPVVDYVNYLKDPEATYRRPKSVLRDIAYSLDWATEGHPCCIRTKTGMRLGNDRVVFLNLFFSLLKLQLKASGLISNF